MYCVQDWGDKKDKRRKQRGKITSGSRERAGMSLLSVPNEGSLQRASSRRLINEAL